MVEERIGMIEAYSPEEVDRFIRFFVDDTEAQGERITFIQAQFNQHVMVQRPRDLPYEIYSHDHHSVIEIVRDLSEITGIEFPNEFLRGTAIYNVPGILMDRGVVVTHRVLRQQIFLGASTSPIPHVQTWHSLFTALGNSVWNFLDHKVWRDRPEKVEVKNEYRDIRGISQENTPRRRNQATKHQQNLFFIAAEDFRYLFGSALAGRGEWYLDAGEMPTPPPEDRVADFWRREISRYDDIYSTERSYTRQEEDEGPPPSQIETAVVEPAESPALVTGSDLSAIPEDA